MQWSVFTCNGVFWSAYLQFILLPKAGEARNLQISVAGGVCLPFLGQIKMHRHVLTGLFRQLHRKNAVMWCHPKDRTHPCCHSSRWEPGNVVLKINPSNTNNIHLICWIVQSSERQKKKKSMSLHMSGILAKSNDLSFLTHRVGHHCQ